MLSKLIIFDLESSFLAKGSKRIHSLIFEIGAVDMFTLKTFHSFVNPFKNTDSSLYDAISENRKQKVSSSLAFWHSLLYHKSSVDMTDKEIANDIEIYNRKHDVPSTQEMLDSFQHFTCQGEVPIEEIGLLAHNGASFDFKIVRGNAQKGSFWMENRLVYIDTYRHLAIPLFKKTKTKKLGLGPLFKELMPKELTFNHHRALDDSLATMCIVHAMAMKFYFMNRLSFNTSYNYSDVQVKNTYDHKSQEFKDIIIFFIESQALPGLSKKLRVRRRCRLKQGTVIPSVDGIVKLKLYTFLMKTLNNPSSLKRGPVSTVSIQDILKRFNTPRKSTPSPVIIDTENKTGSMNQESIRTLKNVGPKTAIKLNNLLIESVSDLLFLRTRLGSFHAMKAFFKTHRIYRHARLATLIENRFQGIVMDEDVARRPTRCSRILDADLLVDPL